MKGAGLDREYYFTLAELQGMSAGYFEADYFSLGKEPVEMTTHCKGIRLGYLLGSVVPLDPSVKKVTITCLSDGYAYQPSIGEVRDTYTSDADPDARLVMILAWEEDTAACALRLVRGQAVEGEYNRTFWVRGVDIIELK